MGEKTRSVIRRVLTLCKHCQQNSTSPLSYPREVNSWITDCRAIEVDVCECCDYSGHQEEKRTHIQGLVSGNTLSKISDELAPDTLCTDNITYVEDMGAWMEIESRSETTGSMHPIHVSGIAGENQMHDLKKGKYSFILWRQTSEHTDHHTPDGYRLNLVLSSMKDQQVGAVGMVHD